MSKRLAQEPYDRYIPWRDGTNTETSLHELLDGLTDGEHIKATWKVDQVKVTAEGAVVKVEKSLWCDRLIRWEDGVIHPTLTSVEVTRDEEVTATRDDEKALHALLDSLEGGEAITAEWRDEKGTTTLTGSVGVDGAYKVVRGPVPLPLCWSAGIPRFLHSITVRRPIVQRWEREGDE